MKRIYGVVLSVLLCIVLASCGSSENIISLSDDLSLDLSVADEEIQKDESVIIWTIPDYADRIAEKEDAINKALDEKGFSYSISFNVIDSDSYIESVRNILKENKTDLAFLGLNSSDSFASELLKENLVEDISDYLYSEQGQKLYECYTPEEWETAEYNGRNYLIPTEAVKRGGDYYIFNKEYFSEADIEGFDGTLESLEELVQEKVPESVDYPLIGDISVQTAAAMVGYAENNGVLTSLTDGTAVNPFEVPEFVNILSRLYQLQEAGVFTEAGDVELLTEVLFSKETDGSYVRSADFGVIIGMPDSGEFNEQNDDVIMVRAPFTLSNLISGSTGICADSEHKEEALELLTLLHTNKELANLMVYGQENVDYQIVNGTVELQDGSVSYVYMLEVVSGLYDNIYKEREDFYYCDARQQKQNFISSTERKDNVLSDFTPDYSDTEADLSILKDLLDFCFNQREAVYENKEENIYISKEEASSFDEWLDEVKREYERAGVENLLTEQNQQIQNWLAEN